MRTGWEDELDADDRPVPGHSSSGDDPLKFLTFSSSLTMRERPPILAGNKSQVSDSVAPIEKVNDENHPP